MPRKELKQRPSAKKTKISIFQPPRGSHSALILWLICCAILGAGYQPLGWWRFMIASVVLLAFLGIVFRTQILKRIGLSLNLNKWSVVLAVFAGLLMADAGIIDSIVLNHGFDIRFNHKPMVRLWVYLHTFCQVLNEEIVLRVLLLGLLLKWFKRPLPLALIGAGVVTLIHISNYYQSSDVFIGWGAVATLFFVYSAANILYLCLGHNGFGLAFHLAWNLNRFSIRISENGLRIREAESFSFFEGSPLVVSICIVLGILIMAVWWKRELRIESLADALQKPTKKKGGTEPKNWRLKLFPALFLLPAGLVASCLSANLMAVGMPYRDIYVFAGIGVLLTLLFAFWMYRAGQKWFRPPLALSAAFAFAIVYSFFSFHVLKAYALWTLDDLKGQGIVLSYTEWAERRQPRSRGSDEFIAYLAKVKEADKDEALSVLAEFANKVERLDFGVISKLNKRKKLIDEAVSLLRVLEDSYFFNPSVVDESPIKMPVYQTARSLVLARLLILRARQYAQEGDAKASVQDIESTLKLGSAFSRHPFFIEKMIGKIILRIAYKGAAMCSSNPSVRQVLEPKWSLMMDRIKSNSVLECFETELIFSASMIRQMIELGYADYWARRSEDPDISWQPGLGEKISLWANHYSGHRIASFARYWKSQARIILSVDLKAKDPFEKMKAIAREDQFLRSGLGGTDLVIVNYERMYKLENEIWSQAFLLRSVWATQEYRMLYGHWPEQAKDIIEILGSSDLLVDPYGKNGSYIKLKPDKGGLYIYSVGVNRKDDGGNLDKRVDLGYFLPA